jgi:hypothetical protein
MLAMGKSKCTEQEADHTEEGQIDVDLVLEAEETQVLVKDDQGGDEEHRAETELDSLTK